MSTLNYLAEIWDESHNQLKSKQSYRKIFDTHKEFNNHTKIINFSSNDYLGLRNEARILEAGYRSALKNGSGCGASRSVLQTDSSIEELENFFCEHTGWKRSLFLPSGFIANLTFFDALTPFLNEDIDQEFFIDHRCHASIFFAFKDRNLKHSIFRHQDMPHLEKKLNASQAKAKIIVVESLFSMDGDFSQGEDLSHICEKTNALLFVDESHSFGIYGPNGRGWTQDFPKLKKYLIAASFGCGKSVGVSGGFLATNTPALIKRILQKSKLFIYSTGISAFISGAVLESLKIIFSEEGEKRRSKLFTNIRYLNSQLDKINFKFPIILEREILSQIVPFIFCENNLTMKISNHLLENQILAKAIRPPSVPNNTSRLRLCLTSHLTNEDIDLFIHQLNKVLL